MNNKTSKEDTLKLLKRKRDGTLSSSFSELSKETGYTATHLKRLYKELDKSDIEKLSIHKNTGNISHNAACSSETDFIVEFKKLYPVISVAQFKDVYEEDVVLNPKRKDDVDKYHLKVRSYNFYLSLFKKNGWSTPIRHRIKKGNTKERPHLLRKPSARKGHLVQIDGTPFDWFKDNNKYCLHLAVDDATTDILAGWFTPHECLYGYCRMSEIMLKKHGIPAYIYSDRHTILKNIVEGGDTLFRMMMRRLGIEQIYALSPEAKGRVERTNGTIQRRLPVDIKRFKIKDYDELNIWFNDYYVNYLNKKFAFTPLDPNSEFVDIVDEHFDYNRIFSVEFERTMGPNSMFSFENHIYNISDLDTGEIVYIRKGVKIRVVLELLTKNLYVIYYSKRYACNDLGPNSKARRNEAASVKELDEILNNLDKK